MTSITVELTDQQGNKGTGIVTMQAPAPVTKPKPGPSPAPRQLVGATVTPAPFQTGTTLEQANQAWQTEFGHLPDAAKLYYMKPLPTKIPPALSTYLSLGIAPIICLDHVDVTDVAVVTAFVKMVAAEAGKENGYWVINQEGNNPHYTLTAPQFIQIAHTLYPAIKANSSWPILYCPSGGNGSVDVISFYPGRGGCDGVTPDKYCTGPAVLDVLNAAASLVDKDKLPAGVGLLEIGITASGGHPTTDQMTKYLTDISGFAKSRQGPGAPYCWWNGGGTGVDNTLVPRTANPNNNVFNPIWKQFVSTMKGTG